MNTAQEQANILRLLIEISYDKRLAITRDDMDGLRACTEREITLVGKLNSLTKGGDVPTDEVIALARELKQRNVLNDDLINTHLEFVNTMIELLTPDSDPLNNFYGGDGKSVERGSAKRPGILDLSV
ncbi:MAG: flagellar protein FlgN [Oscillospiraceae bacterium]|jgi:flagellar biosynthesis/type III secretory pathway chaperone|nr:flagellar protein FlgN [Oscillospiraceae bacterium]